MFNRRDAGSNDRPNDRQSPDRAANNTRVPGESQRTVMPSMSAMQYTGSLAEAPLEAPSASQHEAGAQANETVIAREDVLEGQLRTSRGVRVLGTVRGSIDSASYVHIEANAIVEADISATEVVIGGDYSGNLNCRQRVEIQSTGRVHGRLDTVKLHLHEGGYFDGELHMQKPAEAGDRRSFAGNDQRVRRAQRFTDVSAENSTNREPNAADTAS